MNEEITAINTVIIKPNSNALFHVHIIPDELVPPNVWFTSLLGADLIKYILASLFCSTPAVKNKIISGLNIFAYRNYRAL